MYHLIRNRIQMCHRRICQSYLLLGIFTIIKISYWFAVCITMYIKLVLSNNHKKFMKKNGPRIFLAIVLIIVWYMVPFILTFVSGAPFSFGPTGYKYGNSPRSYLFYSGIVNRSSK